MVVFKERCKNPKVRDDDVGNSLVVEEWKGGREMCKRGLIGLTKGVKSPCTRYDSDYSCWAW